LVIERIDHIKQVAIADRPARGLRKAAADTEQKAAVRHLIDRGDELGGLDRVALLDQRQK
jgi:hypothetical protein